ncbi:MAG: hypothetical protein LKF58_05030 [Bacilli bacterium]|jgi:hypothetical protein|nr:hypothetical protein [Bacilli bacterium]MCH4211113.1 hypothetical protein [Bacilli bacterium]
MKHTRSVVLLAALTLVAPLMTGCSTAKTEVEAAIAAAEGMDQATLYKKAMEEIRGKTMTGIGNSSRGKTAQEYFINYLKGLDADGKESATIRAAFPDYDPDFSATISWTQPKNNTIFEAIDADIASSDHNISMTLIQDANQIQSKELDTGNLLNYVPKEWKGSASNKEPFALQSLNKIFEFNNLGDKTYKNCWDFVRTGETPMFMAPNSEPVGKNWMLMMTNDTYSAILKDAYDGISDATEKKRVGDAADALATKATDLGLGANAKYALAYIQFWMKQYSVQTDDGPICNELVKSSSVGSSGLLVYSKLRSVSESDGVSKKNVTVAAYQDGYKGIGGYMYKHYLQVLKTSPYPYASCAFINFMTCTYDGFKAWGKDIGGYCSNTNSGINQDHSNDGGTDYPVLNDKGYDWWTGTGAGKGNLVIEDPTYCAKVSYKVGSWIDGLAA